jgi:hypothetical protein
MIWSLLKMPVASVSNLANFAGWRRGAILGRLDGSNTHGGLLGFYWDDRLLGYWDFRIGMCAHPNSKALPSKGFIGIEGSPRYWDFRKHHFQQGVIPIKPLLGKAFIGIFLLG